MFRRFRRAARRIQEPVWAGRLVRPRSPANRWGFAFPGVSSRNGPALPCWAGTATFRERSACDATDSNLAPKDRRLEK